MDLRCSFMGSPKDKAPKSPRKRIVKAALTGSPRSISLKQPLKSPSPRKQSLKSPLTGSPRLISMKQPLKSPFKDSPKSKANKNALKGVSKSSLKPPPKAKALNQLLNRTSRSPQKGSSRPKDLNQPWNTNSRSVPKGSSRSKASNQPRNRISKSPIKGSSKSKASNQPLCRTSRSPPKASSSSKASNQPLNRNSKSSLKVSSISKASNQPLNRTLKSPLLGKNTKSPKHPSNSKNPPKAPFISVKETSQTQRSSLEDTVTSGDTDPNVFSSGKLRKPETEAALKNSTVKVNPKDVKRPTLGDLPEVTPRTRSWAAEERASNKISTQHLLLSSDSSHSQLSAGLSSKRPMRGRGRLLLKQPHQSESKHSSARGVSSLITPPEDPSVTNYTEVLQKTAVVSAPCADPIAQRGSRRAAKEELKGGNSGGGQGRKRQKVEVPERDPDTQPPHCSLRVEPNQVSLEQERQNLEETSLSSDLSIELTEEDVPFLPTQDQAEGDEDEEELPRMSFFMGESAPFKKGAFVWCKFRKHPFWPAVVKSVDHKKKKASILFVDREILNEKKRGMIVALKTLKAYNCEERDQLMCEAKQLDSACIDWSVALITDYIIAVGCQEFSGSFFEFLAHDMSRYLRLRIQEGYENYPGLPQKEESDDQQVIIISSGEEELGDDKVQPKRRLLPERRLLPDRCQAARNRANRKLVQFIVTRRMVESHLLQVIGGQQHSKWLAVFKKSRYKVMLVPLHLEDQKQLDEVFYYLKKLYDPTPSAAQQLCEMDRVRFIMDVLIPEAIIHAIAAVEGMSIKEAEKKFLKGPDYSHREIQEMIRQRMS